MDVVKGLEIVGKEKLAKHTKKKQEKEKMMQIRDKLIDPAVERFRSQSGSLGMDRLEQDIRKQRQDLSEWETHFRSQSFTS